MEVKKEFFKVTCLHVKPNNLLWTVKFLKETINSPDWDLKAAKDFCDAIVQCKQPILYIAKEETEYDRVSLYELFEKNHITIKLDTVYEDQIVNSSIEVICNLR